MNKSGKTIRAALALACVAAALHSHAGFTKSVVLNYSYDATQPLQDGTVYFVVPREVDDNRYTTTWFTSAYDERSGLAVAPGATKALVVPFDAAVPKKFYRIEVGE